LPAADPITGGIPAVIPAVEEEFFILIGKGTIVSEAIELRRDDMTIGASSEIQAQNLTISGRLSRKANSTLPPVEGKVIVLSDDPVAIEFSSGKLSSNELK
jgi:hypothetical protein